LIGIKKNRLAEPSAYRSRPSSGFYLIMLSWFRSLFSSFSKRQHSKVTARNLVRLEALEDRRLMAADPITGLGVAGDSLSDEYAYESYSYASNWVESLVKSSVVNAGPVGTYGEPRRSGYEYNWARVDATSGSLLSQGQPYNLSQQINAGLVSHAVLEIGQNDFQPNPLGGAYSSIYKGQWSQSQINSYVDQVVSNISLAVNRLNATSGQLVVSNIIDFGIAPFTKQYFPKATGRERVSNVIDSVNARLSQMADDFNVVLVDTNGLAEQLLGTSTSPKSSWTIGGVKVNNSGGTAATNSFVSDKIHPHTLLQTQVANLFLTGFHSAYGTPVDLFTEREAVTLAKLTYVRDTLGLNLNPFVDLFANAAPSIGNVSTSVTYVENAPPQLLAPDATVTDADNLNFARGALTVTLSGAQPGDQLSIVAGNGISLSDDVVTLGDKVLGTYSGGDGTPLVINLSAVATASDVQSLVQRIGFTTAGDRPLTTGRSATFGLSDGDGGSTASTAVSIAVAAVNDAPTLNMSTAINYYEDNPPVTLSAGPTVTDPDSDDFDEAVLTVANTNGDTDDVLAIGSSVTASGVVTLSGSDVLLNGVTVGQFSGGTGTTPLTVTFNSAATVQTALAVIRNVTFRTRSDEPEAYVRSVRFQLTDGDGGTSNAITKSVTVVLVNDKPTLQLGGNLNFPENGQPRLLASGAVLVDPDSTDFEGGVLSVTISNNATADDRLLIQSATTSVSGSDVIYDSQVIGTFTGGSGVTPLIVTLNANATRDVAEALVRSIAFQTLGDAPSTAVRTVSFKITDGDGGTSNTANKTVTVLASNDSPVLSGGGSVGYTLNDPAVTIAPTIGLADPDNETFGGGLLSIALSAGTNDAYLDIGGSFTISDDQVLLGTTVIGTVGSGYGTANAQLQVALTSAATRSIAEQLLRSIRFFTIDGTAHETRTASFSMTDGSGGTSNTLSVDILLA
jgi:hypothetical protein